MSQIPGYDAAFNAATLTVQSSTNLRMPWENGPLMRTVFGNSDEQILKRPRLSLVAAPSMEASSSSSSNMPTETRREVQLRIPRIKPTTHHLRSTEPEGERQRALEAWLQVLRLNLEESATGRQVIRILRSGLTPGEETAEVSLTVSMASFSGLQLCHST